MSFSVIKYKYLENLLKLDFDLSTHKKWKIVCPNPALADAFREKIFQSKPGLNLETTTVSKYLSDLLVSHFPDKKVYRKSELFLMMATIWKMRFEEEDSSLFHQAFEILTDLRSFTLDKSLIENLLEVYHPVVAEAVRTFWLVMEEQEVLDEHQAYYDLNDSLLSPYNEEQDFESIEGVILLGFTHLSANQLEVLRSLGKTREVFLPIPEAILSNAQWTDWTKWVETQSDKSISLSSDQKEVENNIDIPLYSFPKGRGNSVLNNLLSEKKRDVLFFKKKVSFGEVLEVPSRKHFFKSETNLFNFILTDLKLTLESKFLTRDAEKVPSELLLGEMENLIKALEVQVFLSLKSLRCTNSYIKSLKSMSNTLK